MDSRQYTPPSSRLSSSFCHPILPCLFHVLIFTPSPSLSLYAGKVEELLSDSSKKHEIKFIVLDFTLVLAIDSSAAETIGMYVTLQYSAVDGVCFFSKAVTITCWLIIFMRDDC